jgi:hypothetical protein
MHIPLGHDDWYLCDWRYKPETAHIHFEGNEAEAFQFMNRFRSLFVLDSLRRFCDSPYDRSHDDRVLWYAARRLALGSWTAHRPFEMKDMPALAEQMAPPFALEDRHEPPPPPSQSAEQQLFPDDIDAASIAGVLQEAARLGVPFCEECMKAALAAARAEKDEQQEEEEEEPEPEPESEPGDEEEPGGEGADEGQDEEPGAREPSQTPPEEKPAPGGSKSPAQPSWTVADLKNNLDQCDGGVWAKAKTSNGGKDPSVVTGKSAIGSGGSTNMTTGTVTLDTNQSKCDATQVLVFELNNLAAKPDFDQIDKVDAPAGKLSREEFIRAQEKIEYDNLKKTIAAFDSCHEKWGCNTCTDEWARDFASFDDYYKVLSTDHKEWYGKEWDSKYKAIYEKAHSGK